MLLQRRDKAADGGFGLTKPQGSGTETTRLNHGNKGLDGLKPVYCSFFGNSHLLYELFIFCLATIHW
jgi:hypothetical protein